MEISEFRIAVFDDPISIVLGVGGLVALAVGVVTSALLHRPGGRWLIGAGAVMLAGAVIYTIVAGWLSPGS